MMMKFEQGPDLTFFSFFFFFFYDFFLSSESSYMIFLFIFFFRLICSCLWWTYGWLKSVYAAVHVSWGKIDLPKPMLANYLPFSFSSVTKVALVQFSWPPNLNRTCQFSEIQPKYRLHQTVPTPSSNKM